MFEQVIYRFRIASGFSCCLCLILLSLAGLGDSSDSGPFLDDLIRSRAFRARLGRPRHRGMEKHVLGETRVFEEQFGGAKASWQTRSNIYKEIAKT